MEDFNFYNNVILYKYFSSPIFWPVSKTPTSLSFSSKLQQSLPLILANTVTNIATKIPSTSSPTTLSAPSRLSLDSQGQPSNMRGCDKASLSSKFRCAMIIRYQIKQYCNSLPALIHHSRAPSLPDPLFHRQIILYCSPPVPFRPLSVLLALRNLLPPSKIPLNFFNTVQTDRRYICEIAFQSLLCSDDEKWGALLM